LIDLEPFHGTLALGSAPSPNAEAGALDLPPHATARDGPAALNSVDVVAVPTPDEDFGEIPVPALNHQNGLVTA
jgi:hypothetical protein